MIRGTFFNPSWWERRDYKEAFWAKERMAESEEIRKAEAELLGEGPNTLAALRDVMHRSAANTTSGPITADELLDAIREFLTWRKYQARNLPELPRCPRCGNRSTINGGHIRMCRSIYRELLDYADRTGGNLVNPAITVMSFDRLLGLTVHHFPCAPCPSPSKEARSS